jgi:hypothetical protein
MPPVLGDGAVGASDLGTVASVDDNVRVGAICTRVRRETLTSDEI